MFTDNTGRNICYMKPIWSKNKISPHIHENPNRILKHYLFI